jgi:hypothetical protein
MLRGATPGHARDEFKQHYQSVCDFSKIRCTGKEGLMMQTWLSNRFIRHLLFLLRFLYVQIAECSPEEIWGFRRS